jgi:ureidoglycolate lyase
MMRNGAIEITADALTAHGFAEFGDVLEGAPVGRRYFDEGLGDTRPEAKLRFWLSRIAPATIRPIRCELMEQHPCGTQTFAAMGVSRFLVVVAPPAADGGPDLTATKAFIGSPEQGSTYRAGTWHHGMITLDAPGLFAVMMWKDEGPRDELFVKLSAPVIVNVPQVAGIIR